MINKKIASMLAEIADMLSIEEKPTTRFEVRAYQNASMVIGSLEEDLGDLYKRAGLKGLMDIRGIGKGIASSIEEYIKTGHMSKYETLKKRFPIDFAGLTKIEGLGAKRIITLYRKLGVKNIDDLKKAINSHKVAELEGFGEKSEEMLKNGIEMLEKSKGRLLLGEALPAAEAIVSALLGSGLVGKAVICGSTRRMKETVGDIDILAISDKPQQVMDMFTSMKEVESVVVKGPTKTTVWLDIGTTCDLRVIAPESFGAAVQYFTGSKEHNVEVRKIAISKGFKLNEYGLYDAKGGVISAIDERDIYARLGMDWMEPEMRENRGEIELAKEHRLPKLVALADLRGDMHTHTKETDGTNTLEEMVNAAIAKGFEYVNISNHTKSLRVAHGLDDKGFEQLFKRIDDLNSSLDGKIRIFKGAEVDILKSGALDLKPETLKKMDCVVAAVHSNFNMSQKEMTGRIVKALDSGMVHILAHPTGRIINEREPYDVDLRAVAESAERNNVALEINSFPSRLDLNDSSIFAIKGYKLKFAIDSDAHNISHFDYLRYGVGMARRGWLGKSDILNTMSLKAIEKALEAVS